MDLLLILTYAALCITIFKVFNIPLNKWTVPTAVSWRRCPYWYTHFIDEL